MQRIPQSTWDQYCKLKHESSYSLFNQSWGTIESLPLTRSCTPFVASHLSSHAYSQTTSSALSHVPKATPSSPSQRTNYLASWSCASANNNEQAQEKKKRKKEEKKKKRKKSAWTHPHMAIAHQTPTNTHKHPSQGIVAPFWNDRKLLETNPELRSYLLASSQIQIPPDRLLLLRSIIVSIIIADFLPFSTISTNHSAIPIRIQPLFNLVAPYQHHQRRADLLRHHPHAAHSTYTTHTPPTPRDGMTWRIMESVVTDGVVRSTLVLLRSEGTEQI